MDIRIVEADALAWTGDVLALKYAQSFHGADASAAIHLRAAGHKLEGHMPDPTHHYFLASRDALPAQHVLFVGVRPLGQFLYEDIRGFGRRVLEFVSEELPDARSIGMTLHGMNLLGLDEREALRAQLAGLLDALRAGTYPSRLESIQILDLNSARVERLSGELRTMVQPEDVAGGADVFRRAAELLENSALKSAGRGSVDKPHVFVAMPFSADFDDHFYYGIRGAAESAGLLCERADLSSFTGDVMNWVKSRISSARLVVADLSTANPNVYLEVGYAWGCGRPTVLLVRSETDLRFDVRGQRCLVYQSIRDLEDSLAKELDALVRQGA